MPRAEIPEGVERYDYDLVRVGEHSDGVVMVECKEGDWLRHPDLPAIKEHWLEQLKEERFGDAAQAVVVDFLASWSYCPVSQASDPSRSCLDDAARQLLDALKDSIPIEEGGK